MQEFDKPYSPTIQVCIRVTKAKDGGKITEYTVKGNPNNASGKAAWYWEVLETVVREAGFAKEKSRGILATILGGV